MRANLIILKRPTDQEFDRGGEDAEFKRLQEFNGVEDPIIPRIGEEVTVPGSSAGYKVYHITYSYSQETVDTHPERPMYSAQKAVTVATIRIFVR